MKRVDVDLGARSYPIHIGAGLLDRAAELLEPVLGPRLFIVTDENVARLYLDRFRAALAGHEISQLIVPAGERHKTINAVVRIIDALVANGCQRDTTVIALGGGVVGDMAGFAAACFLRGVDFVQIPTTLLAQVDSSVGGKTGVNHPLGKNLIGAFHQPRAVLIDIDTLRTLEERELRAGLAEVIKYGAIADAEFFAWLEESMPALTALDPDATEQAIETCCRVKAEIVTRDERERGVRALLNFGHTFGHAIEQVTGYSSWLHGEAVAAGMVMAGDLSMQCGELSEQEWARLRALIEAAGLPGAAPGLEPPALAEAMEHDKKARAGTKRFVLLRRLGDAFVSDSVEPAKIGAVLSAHTK